MSPTSRDTSPDAAQVQVEILRSLGLAGRARLFFDLCAQARALTKAGIRQRHPDYSDEQLHLAATKLRLGSELFADVYPGVDIAP